MKGRLESLRGMGGVDVLGQMGSLVKLLYVRCNAVLGKTSGFTDSGDSETSLTTLLRLSQLFWGVYWVRFITSRLVERIT